MRFHRARRRGDFPRFRTLAGFWVVSLLLALPSAGPGRVQAQRLGSDLRSRPNVLFLVADDHAGGTLGVDGDARRATPRLDALARQGVRFDRTYCNAPVCTASRQSFITGRLPHAVGVTRLGSKLPDDAITLGDWLGDLGYLTAAVGKMHFNGKSRHGFALRLDHDDWNAYLKKHPPEGGGQRRPWRPFHDPASVWLNADCRPAEFPEAAMGSTFYADRAIDFLKRRRDDGRSFALVVSFYDPHSPFRFPREDEGRYRPDDFPAPALSDADRRAQPQVFRSLTAANFRGVQAAYYTSLAFVDRQAGRVLDALDATGLGADTVVVYLGDNGYMLGQHGRFEKHCFFEQAVRVPLIVRWPGHLPADRRITEMVELVDVLPTVLDLLGLSHPPDLHGRSLVPLALGRAGSRGRDVVFSEYQENEEAMVRSERYKLIVGTGRRERQDGYQTGQPSTGPYERLYDLEADPNETTDVARRPNLATVQAELRRRMYLRLVSTRVGLEPLPARLTEAQAIFQCLVPRD